MYTDNLSFISCSTVDFFAGKDLPDPLELNVYAKDMLATGHRDLDAVSALESWEKRECEICTQMQRIMKDKKNGSGSTTSTDAEPGPVIIHGPTSWEQHLKSKQHRKMRTSKAEMERDGPNWWYWRAQEYKKRKREGTLNSDVEVVGEVPSLASTTSSSLVNESLTGPSTAVVEEGGNDDGETSSNVCKVRRIDDPK